MTAIAVRLEQRLKTLPASRAAAVERMIDDILTLAEPQDAVIAQNDEVAMRESAIAALDRIASRGGLAGIEDAASWQREQRLERPLPGRDS
jgi:hypothetical protein